MVYFLKFVFSLILIFFISNEFVYSVENNQGSSCIIYLKGSCSSGKSTFIRSILNQRERIEVIDEDSIMQKTYIAAVAERFPYEFACIRQVIAQENLYHAIREKDVLFKKTASEEECKKALEFLCKIQEELNKSENASWKQEVSHSIDLQVLQQIKQTIEKGKIVLLDSWYIKPKHLELHFPETKVFKVLLYCPLKSTLERFVKRNEKALTNENFSEKRYLRQLIGSFISLYEITTHSQEAIEEVNKMELYDIFCTMAFSLKEGPDFYQKPIFTFEEISKPFFMKLVNEFLLPFEDSDKSSAMFYIKPRENYDIILNSAYNSACSFEDLTLLLKCQA